MGKPLKAIPQVTVEDRKAGQVLDALKYVIDVREGRGTADQGKMWVTFDDLWDALKNMDTSGGVLSEEFIAAEALEAGCFVGIFKDTEDDDRLKSRKACGLVDEENQFKTCNGYVLKDYAEGARSKVYYNGINTMYSVFDGLEAGSVVYVSDTAGEVTQTRKTGAKLQMVGMVVKSGILFVPGDVITDCCGSDCSYYGEADETCGIMDVDGGGYDISNDVVNNADTYELADFASPKVFSTLDGAMTIVVLNSGTWAGLGFIDAVLGAEAPECPDAFYFIVPKLRLS